MSKITVVGSTMMDLVSYVERMPLLGETLETLDFSMGFGGKGANQAVAAAKLNAEVSMVAKIGDDLFGPLTKKNLKDQGIHCPFVTTAPGVVSGVAPIFVDTHSRNCILISKGANAHLSPQDIDAAQETIRESALVIMQLEIELETVYHTIELCRRYHIPLLLNPAPATKALEREKIKSVDFFVPNETELAILTGMPVKSQKEIARAARNLMGQDMGCVIVTMGHKGALILTQDKEVLVPVLDVKTKDSTGAGDAFIAAFARYYTENKDLESAVLKGCQYASFSTMKAGTQTSYPTEAEFKQALRAFEKS